MCRNGLVDTTNVAKDNSNLSVVTTIQWTHTALPDFLSVNNTYGISKVYKTHFRMTKLDRYVMTFFHQIAEWNSSQ